MGVSTRIDTIDRDIALLIDEGLSPESRSAVLAEFAEGQIAEVRALNAKVLGAPSDYEVWVDSRRNAPLESVKPSGVIAAEFDITFDVLEWIGEQLVLHSPRRSGRYADSHVLFTDGTDTTGTLTAGREYVFLNVQPYARKIDRGLSSQAPDGVYQAVAAVASRRFGNIARVSFTYRSFLEGAMVPYVPAGRRATIIRGEKGRIAGMRSTRTAAGAAAARSERDNRQPAILVRPY